MGKSAASTTERQRTVCIMCGDKVPVDTARQHLAMNYPDVATLLNDCEKAEELRQALIGRVKLVKVVDQRTGEVESPKKNSPIEGKTNTDELEPANQPQDLGQVATPIANQMISEAQEADYLKVVPTSDDEIDLPENYKLNNVERAFCAGHVLWLQKLTPEERQKEIMNLKPRLNTMLKLYLSDEVRGEIEHKKAKETQERMRDESRDVIIIGRKFICAVVCP